MSRDMPFMDGCIWAALDTFEATAMAKNLYIYNESLRGIFDLGTLL